MVRYAIRDEVVVATRRQEYEKELILVEVVILVMVSLTLHQLHVKQQTQKPKTYLKP